MAMFPDFALSDISNLFMPFPVDDVDPEALQSMDTGQLIIIFVIKPRLHDTTCCQTGFTTG